MPYDDKSDEQEGGRLLFFPGKDSFSGKSWTVCENSTSGFLSSMKVFLLLQGRCTWLVMVAYLELQFSANPE